MTQDEQYHQAAAEFGSALERFARGYEADPERRRDLVQDIHLAMWRSFQTFDGRCSLRTWVYRVAHSVAASHVVRQKRANAGLVGLEELDAVTVPDKTEATDQQRTVEKLLELIRQLKPLDRQIILSYLEGLDAVSIGEIAGISPGNVATKIYRIKNILSRRFQEGVGDGQ